LQALDPEAAATVHANDRRRVVRALELAEAGGSLAPEQNRLWTDETRRPTILFGLDLPVEALGRRIEERAHAMFDEGVEDEVRRALAAGPVSATARHAHGLDEISSLPRDQAIAGMIQRGRRYAAYQRKWMRRVPGLVSLDAERPPVTIAEEIIAVARSRGMLGA
jgi:tRNA dimethylallyltransferase